MEYVYCIMIFGVIGFQIALILGAPLGRYTQGGQTDGPLPTSGRVGAAISIVLLAGFALAILSAAGHWPNWPRWTGWLTAACNGVMMVLNWITPSIDERKVWGPITTVMFVLGLAILLLS